MLREREEMRECTFRPKLLPSRRCAPPTPQPRSFDATVARMRAAHCRRVQRREERDHIPCGENYERLKRLGTQPFMSCVEEKLLARQPPLVYVDVDVGHGRTGRIGVREGDDLGALSRNFARAFQLPREAAIKLAEMLQQEYDSRVRSRPPDEGSEPSEGLAVEGGA